VFLSLVTDCFSQPSIDTGLVSIFYDLWKDSGFGKDPNRTERAAWILSGDVSSKYTVLRWPRSGSRNTEFWYGPVPENVLAQVHTHTVVADPKPARKDIELCKSIGVPMYVVSGNGIWMAFPDGTVLQLKGGEWYKTFN
jgi:hypothetical protein